MYPLIAGPLTPPVAFAWPGAGARSAATVGSRLPHRWPRIGSTIAVTAAILVSLAPGLLPRSAATQAVLTALLVLTALGTGRLFRRTHRRIGPTGLTPHHSDAYTRQRRALTQHRCHTGARQQAETTRHPWSTPFPRRSAFARRRWYTLRNWIRYATAVACRPGPVFTVATIAVLAAVVHAEYWQNTLRDGMDVARTGPQHWPAWAVLTVLLTAGPVALYAGAGRALRRVGRRRALVLAVVAALPLAAVAQWNGRVYAAAEPDRVRPVATTRSGSTESLVSWASLGREGQRYVAAGAAGSVRVYVGLQSAPDPAARAELAVRELDRTGGFDRDDLIVTVPTGSGWVDARALRGFEAHFGGDVAVAALQYSQWPSWATFVFGREAAAVSARALFTAVERHAATLPDPPRLHLYGQSLGAFGGSAVFAGADEQNRRVCSALWTGPPGGAVAEPGARTGVLANSSDPVVRWSPDLLWRAPDLGTVRDDAPGPGWLPGVSFVQTTVDLLGALGAPLGHGHRYGVDQGEALPGCHAAV